MESTDIATILDRFRKGQCKEYDSFVNNLNNPDIESKLLLEYLQGLRNCISLVGGNEFEGLISVVLKLEWSSRGSAVATEYRSLLVELVSAQSDCLHACLRSLVKSFLPRANVSEKREVTDEIGHTNGEQFLNAHLVLKSISQIIPMMSTVLFPIISETFPYLNKSAYIQECYVRNLLQTTRYTKDLRLRILELVIDRMLKIDVRCPRHDIEDSESVDLGEEDMDIFNMDEDERLGMKESDEMKHKDANKLDRLMKLLFSYIQNTCHNDDGLDWETTKQLYREFLLIFDKVIFPTHASCHIQFIMFYLSSMRLAICEGFLDYLWKKVTSPNIESVYRQAAVSYIASLISRGTFVPVSILKACLGLMSCWAHRYLEQASHTSRADVRHHGPFYSVCQAIFYVFAFRHKDILNNDKGYKWAKGLNLQTLVTCRLNPLRFCLPVVVMTFSSVTRSHQLAFCDTIIERNQRVKLPETCSDISPLSNVNILDCFFPFDPYLLLRSRNFIIPLYREYEGQSPEEEKMVSEDEDDFLPEPSKVFPSSVGKSPTDFLSHGTSPGFKHV